MGKNAKRKEVGDAVDAHTDSTTKHSDTNPKKKNKKEDDLPQSSATNADATDIDDLFGQLKNKKKQQQQEGNTKQKQWQSRVKEEDTRARPFEMRVKKKKKRQSECGRTRRRRTDTTLGNDGDPKHG
jgi:hypothetical protein